MLTVVNIGNTNTQFGIFADDVIGNIQTVPTATFTTDLLRSDYPVAVASVVPSKTALFDSESAVLVSPETACTVDFSLIDTSTIGADRVANAVALAHYGVPAICIDAGTALTFEAVNSSGQFVGGAIAPGRMLLRKSLNLFTAQLPEIPLNVELVNSGRTTVEAIALGVDGGYIGSVKEILERIKSAMNVDECPIFVIGGDSSFLVEHISEVQHAPPAFTLRGVAETYICSL